MSSLVESRTRLLELLEAAGIRAATSGRFSAPCVIVEPGDPWAEWARMPGRVYHWRLTAVGGRADSGAAIEELALMVDAIDAAILAAHSAISLPSWARPVDTMLDGVAYAATVATISDTS